MSLKNLVIIGAGDFGRELLNWLDDIPLDKRNWKVKGFIDDNRVALDGFGVDITILSSISSYDPDPDDVFVCAINSPKTKLEICRAFKEKGAEFINIIHPSCIIGSHNQMGTGIIMCPNSLVSSHVKIGDFVTINVYSSIGHDAILRDGVTLSGHCDVTGYARLDEGVFMGSGARMLPGSYAEKFSIIGAGTVVLKRVRENRTVFGVPARYID